MQDEMIQNKDMVKAEAGRIMISGILQKTYGEDVMEQHPLLLDEVQYFIDNGLSLERDIFEAVFNPENENVLIREVLNGIKHGVPADAYKELLKENKLTYEEAAEIRERCLVKDYDSQLADKNRELTEGREQFVSYVNTQMESFQNLLKEQADVFRSIQKMFESNDDRSKDEYDDWKREKKEAYDEEKKRLQDETREKIKEYRDTISAQKEEINSLNEKLRIHMEETIAIREERAKLSAWNEIYKNDLLEKEQQRSSLKEHEAPALPEKRGRFGGRKKQATSGQKEMVSILCMKEVSDEQAEALVEAWKKGASIEKIREVAQANVSVERIRLMFDIDQILNGGESK